MQRKPFFSSIAKGGMIAAALTALALLPAAWKLRSRRPRQMDDFGALPVLTLDDAAVACRCSGLGDWDLVTYAQQLVQRKFVYYSVRNLWDTPARAFVYGMGYCTQYNLALAQLLAELGIRSEAVFCMRVRVHDNPAWRMGHTWLRVTIDGVTLDVCAARAENRPGHVGFTPLARVRRGVGPVLLLLHLGMIPYCGWLEWRALLTGQGEPAWMFVEQAG